MTEITSTISERNTVFWDTLCGSHLAKHLGVIDDSIASLDKYDTFYLDFYPYLLKHVDLSLMKDKDVVEIGLGYGTLGQQLASVAKTYVGIDIAEGPVNMTNHRLKLHNLQGYARQGSVLTCFLPDKSVDVVVSIGCFHHTGDVAKCIQESYRILRPGGILRFMVYNKYSLRRWKQWSKTVLKEWWDEFILRKKSTKIRYGVEQRKPYDAIDDSIIAAPETTFLSCAELNGLLKKFTHVKCYKENTDPVMNCPRKKLLKIVGNTMGLDIYVHAKKPL